MRQRMMEALGKTEEGREDRTQRRIAEWKGVQAIGAARLCSGCLGGARERRWLGAMVDRL